MNTPQVGRKAAELLTIPVITDDDVLARVAAIIDPAARRQRILWLFFLDNDGIQADLVVPVDDFPELPDPALIGSLCSIATESIARAAEIASVIITLSRPGPPDLGEPDQRLLRALQRGAARHATPVRMFCLATADGVRELGPVR
jgi:hypothetical protein